MSSKLLYVLFIFLLLSQQNLSAEQTQLPNYATVQDSIFWENLYPDGGFSFYIE